MWLSPDSIEINDDAPYVGTDGTQYPSNFPKDQIAELTQVVETPQPETAQYQTAAYTIVNGVQVWTLTDWPQEKIDAHLKSLVPKSVSMRQARLALLGAGLLDSVNANIAAMPSPQKEAAQIEWEYSGEVWRDKALVKSLGPLLGLNDAQLDALFIAAGKIT